MRTSNIAVLICVWVVVGVVAPVQADDPLVYVQPVATWFPSGADTTDDPLATGFPIESVGELERFFFVEIWVTTTHPNGLFSAVVNLEYPTELIDTQEAWITLNSVWEGFEPYEAVVDDPAGVIVDIGGTTFDVQGIAPEWSRLASVRFEVIETPMGAITFSTAFPGSDHWFGILGYGAVLPEDVEYGACTIPGETGACCYPDGSCVVTDAAGCADEWLGAGTVCDPNPCGSSDWCMGDMDCSGGSPDFADILYFAAAVGDEAGWTQYYRDRHAGEDPPCPWALGDYTGGGVEFSDIVPFSNSVGQECEPYEP